MKKLFLGLVSVIFLFPFSVLAAYSSSNYKLQNLNFGQEVVVHSTDFAAPTISAEGPVASEVQSDQAKISWTTNKESNSIVSFGTSSGTTDTDFGKNSEYVKNHEITLTGLTPETIYYYKVKSTDAIGNTGTSAEKSFTTTQKSSITGVTISDITLNSAIIAFETNVVTNVELNYGPTSAFGTVLKEQSGSQTTRHTLKLTDLTQGTTYYFQLKASDEYSKKTFSDVYVFSTLPLPTISAVTFSKTHANWVILKWNTNTETDSLLEYWTNSDLHIEGLKAGDKQSVGSSERTKEHEAKVINLIGSTSYSFKIYGTDKSGNRASPYSGIFTTIKDTSSPLITKLKADTSTASEDRSGKIQMSVSWETNELSSSQVAYGKGRSETPTDKTTPENVTLTTTHYNILTGLDQSTTYHLKAVSRDPAGNSGVSELTTVLTPKKKLSLFQLIVGKLTETFGWIKRVKL